MQFRELEHYSTNRDYWGTMELPQFPEFRSSVKAESLESQQIYQQKIDKLSTETQSQRTPAKFGIIFTSQDRHSTTTIPPPSAPPSSSIRTQSTETSINHEASKNYDENMENDKNQYLLIIIMIIQL
ncbi:unnamed protein product [Rotaria sp. Silwood1]|nr:unnamed protein product [Rotaria sp. Silwood1]